MDYQQIKASNYYTRYAKKKDFRTQATTCTINMLMMTIDTGTVAKSSRYEMFLPYRGIPMPGVTTVVERKGR